MAECDLYPPVRDWLIARGYIVHVEIFGADIVAVKDGRLTVVELKACLSIELINQCANRAGWADFVYAAIASQPRSLAGLKYHGFGVLQVANGKCRQRAMPRPQPWTWHKRHAYRVQQLTGRPPAMPHETAGLPSCAALRIQREQRSKT